MDRDYLQKALSYFNTEKPQWYGWRKDYIGNERMTYENLILNDNTAVMPSKAEVEAKIQEIKDAEVAKEQAEQSAINKLKALGLTDAEVEAYRK